LTAQDFIAAGVDFGIRGDTPNVTGPDDENLRAQLRHEISKRDPTARVFHGRTGACQSCGDPMRRGGNCELCICASYKRNPRGE